MNNTSGNHTREHGRQLQEKFELYLLGLIFTLLALAVQTAKFGTTLWADGMEVAGWVALLISGLVGLSRMEWIPVTHGVHGAQLDIEAERNELRAAAERGVRTVAVLDSSAPADVHELIADRDSAVTKLEGKKKAQEAAIRIKYVIHKWTFVAGLCLLMGARASVPFGQMIDGAKSKPTTTAPTSPSASSAAAGSSAGVK